MEIPTLKTQMKIAGLLHDIGCADKPTTHDPGEPEKCVDWPSYVFNSAFFLARLAPSISTEMFPAVRADERDKLAYYIRAELVCCDLAEQIGVARDSGQYPVHITNRDLAKLLGLTYHSICYYGGWAAQLAQDGPEHDGRDTRMPCVEQGGTEPCGPVYFCQVSGENESPCHGGFDNCCSQPELHGPAQ